MTTENPITKAQTTIGFGQSDDYILQPAKHAEEFTTSAPDLVAILISTELAITGRQYEAKDQEALAAQKEFRRIFNRANLLVLLTAVLTALVLTTGVLSALLPDTFERILLIALSAGSVIAGALAAKDLYMIRQGKLLEDWMTKRAAAESKRLEFFYTMAKAEIPAAENGVPLNLLKLEYFRRFQLDVQLAFFSRRSADHKKEAKKSLAFSGIAIAGAAIVTGLAGVLTIVNASFAAIASLGAVFTALSSYATLREQIYQSQRIAERYALTSDALQDLYKRLDAVRKAVLADGQEPLLGYIEAIHEVLLAEHKQWLGEQEQRSPVLDKLDSLLKNATATSSGKEKETAPKESI
jgi:hypothetical protein